MIRSARTSHSSIRRNFTAHVASILLLMSGCSGDAHGGTPSPQVPTYNFAGISTHQHAAEIEGIRATINWSVDPSTTAGSAQSTWIGIFGQSDPRTHLSSKIAQIGWKQQGTSPPRVFWEWGTDSNHVSIFYGDIATPPLTIELDRDPAGNFSFIANCINVGTVSLAWYPTFEAVAAETHRPSDLLAGSADRPEAIDHLEWRISGNWSAISAEPFSSNPFYRV